MAFQDEQRRAVDRVIALAWQSDSFKQQLITDPMRTLSATGLQLPAGIEYRVVENTATVQYLVIPAKPVGPVVGEIVEDAVRSASSSNTCNNIRGGRPPGRRKPSAKRPKPSRKKGAKKQPKRGRKQGGRKGGRGRK